MLFSESLFSICLPTSYGYFISNYDSHNDVGTLVPTLISFVPKLVMKHGTESIYEEILNHIKNQSTQRLKSLTLYFFRDNYSLNISQYIHSLTSLCKLEIIQNKLCKEPSFNLSILECHPSLTEISLEFICQITDKSTFTFKISPIIEILNIKESYLKCFTSGEIIENATLDISNAIKLRRLDTIEYQISGLTSLHTQLTFLYILNNLRCSSEDTLNNLHYENNEVVNKKSDSKTVNTFIEDIRNTEKVGVCSLLKKLYVYKPCNLISLFKSHTEENNNCMVTVNTSRIMYRPLYPILRTLTLSIDNLKHGFIITKTILQECPQICKLRLINGFNTLRSFSSPIGNNKYKNNKINDSKIGYLSYSKTHIQLHASIEECLSKSVVIRVRICQPLYSLLLRIISNQQKNKDKTIIAGIILRNIESNCAPGPRGLGAQ